MHSQYEPVYELLAKLQNFLNDELEAKGEHLSFEDLRYLLEVRDRVAQIRERVVQLMAGHEDVTY